MSGKLILSKAKKNKGKKHNKKNNNKGIIPTQPRRSMTDVMATWAPLFPARTTRMLRYSSSFYLAGTSGVVASNVIAANGLYDPEITGGGHQPMGFDQMMLSYNHYYVHDARLIVTFHNLASSTSPVVSIRVDGSSTPVTVVDQILEFGINQHTVLEAKSTQGDCKVLESRVSIARFEGVDDVMDVIELSGSVAANPAELCYFHVQAWDNAGVTSNILCEIIMEFRATFTEPRTLSASLGAQLKKLIICEEKTLRR